MNKTYTLEELAELDSGTTIVCDEIPFTMLCSFFSYENWEVQIIRNVINFKKKYDKWPNFIIANTITYHNCIAAVEKIFEKCETQEIKKDNCDETYDWGNFDINEPLEKYPLQSMPVTVNNGLFSTPLF